MSRRNPLALRWSSPSVLPADLDAAAGAGSVSSVGSATPASSAHRRPVLLLHGSVDSPGAWQALARSLHDAGFSVFAPAFGNRGTDPVAQSVRDVADYAAQILNNSASERLDIVGHSQGGLIAFELLRDQRLVERIGTVVSISGTVHGFAWPRQLRWVVLGRKWLARLVAGPALVDQLERYRREGDGGSSAAVPPVNNAPLSWVNLLSRGDGLVGWSSAARESDFAAHFASGASEAAAHEVAAPETATSEAATQVTTIWIEDLIGRTVPHWQQQADEGVVKLVKDLLLGAEDGWEGGWKSGAEGGA